MVIPNVGADLLIGKDLTDPGRDDFEYHVSLISSSSSSPPFLFQLPSTPLLTMRRSNGRARLIITLLGRRTLA